MFAPSGLGRRHPIKNLRIRTKRGQSINNDDVDVVLDTRQLVGIDRFVEAHAVLRRHLKNLAGLISLEMLPKQARASVYRLKIVVVV